MLEGIISRIKRFFSGKKEDEDLEEVELESNENKDVFTTSSNEETGKEELIREEEEAISEEIGVERIETEQSEGLLSGIQNAFYNFTNSLKEAIFGKEETTVENVILEAGLREMEAINKQRKKTTEITGYYWKGEYDTPNAYHKFEIEIYLRGRVEQMDLFENIVYKLLDYASELGYPTDTINKVTGPKYANGTYTNDDGEVLIRGTPKRELTRELLSIADRFDWLYR